MKKQMMYPTVASAAVFPKSRAKVRRPTKLQRMANCNVNENALAGPFKKWYVEVHTLIAL